jgi:hypothetical protein
MTTASPRSGIRRLIASYPTYEEAQRAVDTLSDRKFPVERVTIVGSDLRLVERVTGRLTVLRAALLGAAAGGWIGLLIGLVFWIVSPWTVGAIVSGLVAGLVFGAIWGAIAQALTGGRRDFASIRGLEAGRYDVLVEEPHAEAGRMILAPPSGGDRPIAADRPVTAAGPMATDRPVPTDRPMPAASDGSAAAPDLRD